MTALDLPEDFFVTFPKITAPKPQEEVPVLGGTEGEWLNIAEKVLAGEFDGSDKSTRRSIRIGLRWIKHPTAKLAIKRLFP